MLKFPKNFLWGAATSAPQSEGHATSNGKTPTTWDKWYELDPTKFTKNQGPENTSNMYDMYREDAKLMPQVGMNSFRTSISWARLLPDGQTVNPEAVAFYRSYFEELHKNKVKPIINLFHFDMPWWLMEKGGWEARESVEAFAFYAKTAFELFGDLVEMWTTFNEPIVHVECGYLYGYHYPAIHDFKKAIQVGYNTIMAHTMAVKNFREMKAKGQIGIILNVSPCYSRGETEGDKLAAKQADLLNTKSFLDPAVLGQFPKELVNLLKENELLPTTQQGDKEAVSTNTVDFIGLNYYQPRRVQEPVQKLVGKATDPSDFYAPYVWPDRKMNVYRGWEIYPEALYDVAMMMKNDYDNMPWFVSENGMGVAEEERFLDDETGMIQDDYRIEFMKEHLEQLHKGIEAGSQCFGYQTWTFVDCWSWLNGYTNRYGFYRVELDNNYKRTMKKSGLWFKELSDNNGF
ncbi:glycoside hydrolase family 1 protein [Vagococcus intermedius]|uniref:Glycoside hydrolase family 1 protein n=1 Tax=Vagococcus intermedius TaxID=2991418 RepID=A0AAF0CU39_9ENTE|nr:glycoside hydrolase family 1 protein [Vagococcus intermedius]WEG72881.1 glycoside hydrolase family 1 protein [Vagococcus intermedius]WEG74968.1 glycoside hydrolase family 1 protein [Vagococcus intermedius]